MHKNKRKAQAPETKAMSEAQRTILATAMEQANAHLRNAIGLALRDAKLNETEWGVNFQTMQFLRMASGKPNGAGTPA
jgi:hypothetical protein